MHTSYLKFNMAYLMISDKIPTVNDNHTATQSITRASHYRTGFGTSEWRYSSLA
ncbi:hypothetical protein BN3204_100087 [Escherichia coli]|nr:hypothetical protein BN3204_100087 [Escherichia coli]CUX86924.1 hypothetical protein BN3564_44086 [Escherichia coli]